MTKEKKNEKMKKNSGIKRTKMKNKQKKKTIV